MSLNTAHEGYEYQDLLTSYYILEEMLKGHKSSFKIDIKEFSDDKFDDLTINSPNGIFKKQIKYSNETTDRELKKDILSAKSTYSLHLDGLFRAWKNNPQKNNCSIQLCLAWNKPTDGVLDILTSLSSHYSFPSHQTNSYQVNIDKLWPEGKEPLSNWSRFKRESAGINRNEFKSFCEKLIIETGFPKISSTRKFDGELEKIVINQIEKLGIGEFPNDNIQPYDFALRLVRFVQRSRSRELIVTTDDIFRELKIKTNFGSIEQIFPVDKTKNIQTVNSLKTVKEVIANQNKTILIGEPGSGKSWLVQNLENEFISKGHKVIRHYCYTDLKDKYVTERITINRFYGNLINDIIKAFPELSKKKIKKFASNLSELNQLLKSIKEKTVLIIDGLDHIERVFDLYQTKLTKEEVDIIRKVGQLETSENVSILIVSQPLNVLQELSDFKTIKIPNWTITEVKNYLQKRKIKDVTLKDNHFLSQELLKKSGGNPLYLSYLVNEVGQTANITISTFDELPSYDFNLKKYYEHLLQKLDFDEVVPQVLSGANFSLSKNDLKEITYQGKKVDKAISSLRPILKESFTSGEFLLYHESFRRFIIERLKNDEVDITRAIFKPIIEWFSKKDFFTFHKAFRYFFQLLYDNQKFDEITSYINANYIIKGIYHGYSFEDITNNYLYFAKSVIKLRDFPNVILANELNKVLGSTEDAYSEGFGNYLIALGHLRGFDKVVDFLVYEGQPTVTLSQGIEGCYICSLYGQDAPWHIYNSFFDLDLNDEDVYYDPDNFIKQTRYKIRGLLCTKATEKLVKTLEEIKEEGYLRPIKVFVEEFNNFEEKQYCNFLKQTYPIIAEMLDYTKPIPREKIDILKIASQLVHGDNISDERNRLVDELITGIKQNEQDEKSINAIIDLFKAKNWFFNWLIYCIKIVRIKNSSNSEYSDVKQAFMYLIYDTEPFKGKPRASDLYGLRETIKRSIEIGLDFLNSKNEWNEIIDILVQLTDKTTAYIQRSIGGPFGTDYFFKTLDKYANQSNRAKIIKVFEEQIESKKEWYLHAYIADFYFLLSKQYSILGDKENANLNFEEGIYLYIGYTFRRDLTLDDLIDGIKGIDRIAPHNAQKAIKDIQTLVQSVISHTDGKETKWYPITWFDEYLGINQYEASIYLLNQLLQVNFDWRHERQLQDLMIKSNGSINPIIELFITHTFPVDTSSYFFEYCINLVEQTLPNYRGLSQRFFKSLLVKTQIKDDKFSNSIIERIKRISSQLNIEGQKIPKAKNETYNYHENKDEEEKQDLETIKNALDEPIERQIEFFSSYKVKPYEEPLLKDYFSLINELSPDIKVLISVLVDKNEARNYSKEVDFRNVFVNDNEVTAFYWVCKYMLGKDGNLRSFKDKEALKKAHQLSPNQTVGSIFEHIPPFLENVGFNLNFSGELINALVEIGFEPTTIQAMWDKLYTSTSLRLPIKDIANWDELLDNELQLNQEEVLICLLFTRFKSNTTERHHWTLSGLYYLYENHLDKMIKPTKWFLSNHEYFLQLNLVIVLEILFDIHQKNPSYYKNFEEELNNIFPTNHFLMDFIIGKILSKNRNQLIHHPRVILDTSKRQLEVFRYSNIRNRIIENQGFDIKQVAGKFFAELPKTQKNTPDYLANRMIYETVKNIYIPNLEYRTINTVLYEAFEDYWLEAELYDFLHIHYQALVAQTNAYSLRPSDLPKPHTIIQEWTKEEVQKSEWVRIGYLEYEIYENRETRKQEYHKVYQGVVFQDNLSTNFPYARQRMFPQFIWRKPNWNTKEYLVLEFSEEHTNFENFHLLWINPILLHKLNLSVLIPKDGLQIINSKGETVIKYNRWSCEYAGNGDIAGIRDEIPKLHGAELVCRLDYFEQICAMYQSSPFLYTRKVKQFIEQPHQ